MINNPNPGFQNLQKGIKIIILLFKISVIILVISFCISGFFALEKNETALILRLGTVEHSVNKEGLFFALPKPIDKIVKISKRLQNVTHHNFMYSRSNNLLAGTQLNISPELDPITSGYLMTKDNNIVHLESTLTYQVIDPLDYAINTNANKRHLIALLNNLLIKIVADKNLSEVFSTKNFSIEVKEGLQKYIDQLKLGLEIVNLNLQVYYPKQVEADYLAVNKQKNESSQAITIAHSIANQLRTEGVNESVKIVGEAENFKENLIGKTKDALATLDEFQKRYEIKNETTKDLILYERLGKIFKEIKQIFIIPENHQQLRINIDKPQDTFTNDKEEKDDN